MRVAGAPGGGPGGRVAVRGRRVAVREAGWRCGGAGWRGGGPGARGPRVRVRGRRVAVPGGAGRRAHDPVWDYLAVSAYPIHSVGMARRWFPLLLGRLRVHRPVVAAAALTILIAATVAGTLGTLGGEVLREAALSQLSRAPGTVIALNGTVTGSSAAPATGRVRAALRAGLGPAPFTLVSAVWSDQLPLPALPPSGQQPPGPRAGSGPGATARRPPAASRGGAPVREVQAAVMSGIEPHAVLVTGRWPGSSPPGAPIPAALPVAAASRLHLAAGSRLTLRDVLSHRVIRLIITGLYRPRDPAAPYWRLDLIGSSGQTTVSQFTTYGPLLVPPAAFRRGLTVDAESWAAAPVLRRIPEAALGRVAAALSAQLQVLQDPSGPLGGLQVTTGLPAVLRGTADALVVARSLLAIAALQVLLLAGAALAASARLLAGQRAAELALMAARGGGRWQIARITAAEAGPLAAGAAVAGALASGVLAAALVRTGPLRTAGLGVSGVPPAAWQAVGAVALLAVIILLLPAFRPAVPGLVRAARGRQAALSRAAQAGADVALILLAALAVWQLRRYSAVAPSASGRLGVDPVLVVAPAVALAGGTVAALRVLPVAARAGERLAARGRHATAALTVWRIGRRPLRQAGPALLIVLGVATGTLVLCQHQSWLRSSGDQAAFGAGAQVRADAPEPFSLGQAGQLAVAAGRHASMSVARTTEGSGVTVLAVDARHAAGTVLLRPDLSAEPAPALFGRITRLAVPGLALPGRPARVTLIVSLGPAALRLGTAAVTAVVQDGDGGTYVLPAGGVPADGRPHRLTIVLARRAVYPLRLLQISAAYSMPASQPGGDAFLTVGGISGPAGAAGAAGPAPPGAPGTALPGRSLARWAVAATSPEMTQLQDAYQLNAPAAAPDAVSWDPAARGAQVLAFSPGYGTAASLTGGPGAAGPARISGLVTLSAPRLGQPVIPGIATRAFLASGDLTAGSVVQASLGGSPVPVRIVASVAAFPTVGGRAGALVVDLGSLDDSLVAQGQPQAGAAEWWQAGPRVPAALPGGSAVTTRAALAARLLASPVSAAPQQVLLAIAVTGAVLALAGFGVSVMAGVRERSLESALLSALGVSRGAQVRQLCLEQLMLSGPAAVTGVLLGAAAAVLLVPAVTLTPGATAPVPPPLTSFDWPQVILLAIAVTVLPVLAAALTIARRPDPAARLRAAESG